MSGDDFGAYGGRPTNEAIHILIEENGQSSPPPPTVNNSSLPNITGRRNINMNSPSSSLHTMFNRMRQHTIGNTVGRNNGNGREWHMNLNDVLSFSRAPRTLRSLISHSGNFRYANLPRVPGTDTTSDNIHLLFDNPEHIDRSSESTTSGRFSHSPRADESSHSHLATQHVARENIFGAVNTGGTHTTRTEPITNHTSSDINPQNNPNDDPIPETEMNANEIQPQAPHARPDDDNTNNVFSDIFVRVLGNFVRYMPFLAILFVKFIHDHLIGILDIVLLQSIMYTVNKSLCNQISKFSQKKYCVLLRDCALIIATVSYRLMMAPSSPDPFGLIIAPPKDNFVLEISETVSSPNTENMRENSQAIKLLKKYLSSVGMSDAVNVNAEGNTITVTNTISLGLLIYYVAVNDLFLKLVTILTKILITILPNNLLRHKQKARMYVLIEYFSQFYRSLAPIRQWLIFLFNSYTGLEVMSGILFAACYVGAKFFEFTNRGKMLRKAFVNFIRNMDYERKPTKDELDSAGTICPICHDCYNTPIILSCNHIFCDDCVGQWFKREQTCPMCRAKVCEDPQWQDGSTTYFYQLC